jgi:hypothetical protein
VNDLTGNGLTPQIEIDMRAISLSGWQSEFLRFEVPSPCDSADWFIDDELGGATGAEPQHRGGETNLDHRERRRQRHDG